ncbi:class I SAM-dependent methyltransferase [Cohaesibacter celericrescens]|uniref:class I SAM-dependent methyltransferase n=1 Tax=Cohaesibacter celericrescens TaxID=2067669 RepID=UPI0035630C80
MSSNAKQTKQLDSAKALLQEIGKALDVNIGIKLWDGSITALGSDQNPSLILAIHHPGVVTSLLRRPKLDNIIRPYINGLIDIEGGNLLDLGSLLAFLPTRKRLKAIPKRILFNVVKSFIFAPGLPLNAGRAYKGDEQGQKAKRSKADDKNYIQFHYDVSNDFYKLFLDPQRLYSCAYFTDWNNDLEQAQLDKIDMICRKLRLKPDERFLDIGCGWGALIIHAATHYGVKAHGVTLSQEQYDHVSKKVTELGLSDKITVELKDYTLLDGPFDKISSIGMMEHIGQDNLDIYCGTVNRLLVDKGLFLNHAISRKAKKQKRKFSSRPEQRALQKYIFPGGELIDLGETIAKFEHHKFEIMDVEGWREHYQLTTKFWLERLEANKDEAIKLVGEEVYRIWVAYLAGCSLAFMRGSARLYQTLASKNAKGPSRLPPSRADLYQ